MDRLSFVGALAVLASLVGCSGPTKPPPPPPPTERVESIAAAPKKEADTGAFCDARPNTPFAFPALDGAPPPTPAAGQWRWLNAWATWCEPCVEEIPRLLKWNDKLVTEGLKVTLQFMSADVDPTAIDKFKTAHPASAPVTSRIQNQDVLSPWLKSIGLNDAAALPLHLFIDPQNTLRCVRMGALSDTDYDVVKAVLNGK